MTSRFSSSHLKNPDMKYHHQLNKNRSCTCRQIQSGCSALKEFLFVLHSVCQWIHRVHFYLLSYFNFIRVCKIFSLLVAIIERKYLWNSFAIFLLTSYLFSCGLLSGCCILRLPGLWLWCVLCLLCRLSGRCISCFRKDRIGIIFRWNITYIRRIVLFILRVTAWAVSFDFFTLRYPFSSK